MEQFFDQLVQEVTARVLTTVEGIQVVQTHDVDEVVQGLAEAISIAEISAEIDLSALAGEIDLSALAGEISVGDVAAEIAVEDVATEIDLDEVVQRLTEDPDFIDAVARRFALVYGSRVREVADHV